MRGPWLVAVGALALVGAACTGGDAAAPPPTTAAGPRSVYVAVGASETVGVGSREPLRDAWTQVLFRTGLPRQTTFVNLGVPGSTVDDAIDEQLPEALRLEPTLVTVWLNVNDLLRQVEPSVFEGRLTRLLTALRRDGATRVLVANTPPLDRLPAYLACRGDAAAANQQTCLLGPDAGLPRPEAVQAMVDTYNQAIGRAASTSGAEVVDLHALVLEARTAGTEATMVSDDGFHPSAAGYEAVAEAFAAALRR